MNTIKKFVAIIMALVSSFMALFTRSTFINNPKLIVEQLKQTKLDKLKQIDEALLTTKQQINKWNDGLKEMTIKCENCNARIAKFSAENKLEQAGREAQLHERQTKDIERLRENIAKCEATYATLLDARGKIEAQYDSRISEAESSIATLAMNRQMIELYTLTGKTLAADVNTDGGISAELIAALDEERLRLESELTVREDINNTSSDDTATSDDAASALARWTAANKA